MAVGSVKFDKVIGLYHATGGLYGGYISGLKSNFNVDLDFKARAKGLLLYN